MKSPGSLAVTHFGSDKREGGKRVTHLLLSAGVFAKWKWSILNGGATEAVMTQDGSSLPARANGGAAGNQGAGSNMDEIYYPEMYPRYWQGVQPAGGSWGWASACQDVF
eukprot:scaffold5110_cov22-Tisochrysis_lutea.AAC.4